MASQFVRQEILSPQIRQGIRIPRHQLSLGGMPQFVDDLWRIERREIADRAYARAHRERTYEIRLTRMFTLLGLATDPTSLREQAESTQPS